jgi:release factor glutamine methyltransferase
MPVPFCPEATAVIPASGPVYAPQHDTGLLADALRREPFRPGTTVLDVGCGGGTLALRAARAGARVTAVDRTAAAVRATRAGAARAGLPVEVLRGDLFTPVAGRRFDLILSNPPYVPAPAPVPPRGPAVAWDAGPDGRDILDRLCDGAPGMLRPGGVLLLVHSALCGADRTLARLARAGLRAEITDRRTVPFGPVMAGRRRWLERRGLVAAGQDAEELVVVRAR